MQESHYGPPDAIILPGGDAWRYDAAFAHAAARIQDSLPELSHDEEDPHAGILLRDPDPQAPGVQEGRQQLREFVRSGGALCGFCAGMFYSVADTRLHLLGDSIEIVDRAHWRRGVADVPVHLSGDKLGHPWVQLL